MDSMQAFITHNLIHQNKNRRGNNYLVKREAEVCLGKQKKVYQLN